MSMFFSSRMRRTEFPPIGLERWRETPCVNDRPATANDAGRAAISDANPDTASYFIQPVRFPACGLVLPERIPVVLINMIFRSDGRPIYGCRKMNGGSRIAEEHELKILGEPDREFLQLVRALPPPYDARSRESPPQAQPFQKAIAYPQPFVIREVLPEGRLLELLLTFGRSGVVDHVPLAIEGSPLASRPLHAEAARLSLAIIQRHHDESCYHYAVSSWEPCAARWRMTIDESKLRGTEVSRQEFIGGGYDWAKGTLHDDNYCLNMGDDYATDGYAAAFRSPPHGLGMNTETATKLFSELNSLLFGGIDHPALEIFSWSVDCSNYFDAGRDWWGAWFWTLYNRETKQLAAILASTTD